ncbi:MAG TPA: tetratricopeptide repeat protein [Verrucomicrobiae bacterium]|nr:tetratricopeptide repeat protein [Verrucomicrobiae bacterium]
MDSYGDSTTSAIYTVQAWGSLVAAILLTAFNVWMIIDAIRKREWGWVVILIFFWGLGAVFYFFYVFRGPTVMRGFELPGAQSRRRIKELQAQIHHLDKAHHYSQLGDVYFQQGKLDKAEAAYRAALERDGQDLDTRAHLGQCLLRLKRPAEAKPLLQGVLRENPKHEYNYTAMAYAETLMALGESDDALKSWQYVVANNSYPRAKVQLAELYLAKNQPDLARAELNAVLTEDPHAPAFQRKRDRVWVSRAKALMRKIGG